MRFKWRRHFALTAFALASMLPLAGCSSQQQQAQEEVGAEGQEGEEGEGGQEATAQQGEAEGEGGQEATASEEATGNPTEENTSGGENVVTNNAAPAAEGSANGDLQEIITEMNGGQSGQAATEAAPEAAPVAEAPAPDPSTVNGAAPAAAPAPAEAPAAPAVASEPAPAAAPGLPEMGSKMPYVVEAGDTLAKIATKIYGDQKRWREIAGLSGMENPNHIYPGDLVYYSLDQASTGFASNYEAVKRMSETVRENDTLAAIAQRVYGNGKLWKHIWRQNDQIDNPDKLEVGMTVYYIEKGAIKTALNKIKSADFSKLTKSAAKKIAKTGKLMTHAKTTLKAAKAVRV